MRTNNTTLKNVRHNGQKVKKWYHNGTKVYSAGNVVTYYFNQNDYAQEEIDSEASCLTPKTVDYMNHFSGWTFVGWREDNTASSTVLASKVMGDEPITLYAVYKRTLTATFNGNGATSGSVASISGTQYYNNGNTANPVITLPANGYGRSDYAFTGWNYGAVGAQITLTDNITVYAQWRQTVVRLVHNSALVSGVGMAVYNQFYDDKSNPPQYYGSSVNLYMDGDDNESSRCIVYFTSVIPYGKTVHMTLRATNISGSYGTANVKYFVCVAPTSGAYPSQISDFIDLSNYNGVAVSYAYTNAWSNTYFGLQLQNGTYGSSSRWVRFTVEELYYDA